jgi:positive regulator of sigma E activity
MRNKILFLIVVFLFLFSRLYKIDKIPQSAYWDEASIGYNAYSVLTTGKDEWGEFLPLHFRAFGEFKLPVYIYSAIPFIYFLGLNELSIRLPSVLFSLGSLILVYFLSGKLFKSKNISLFSAFLFVALPWNFIFSRTGYEASAGLFFYLSFLFVWLFYRPLEENNKNFSKKILTIFISLLFLILSFYSYNSFRFWSPLTFIFLMAYDLINQRAVSKRNLILILASLFIFLLSFYPIYRLYKFDYGSSRFQAVSLQGSYPDKALSFLKNYASHFSFDFLFSSGDKNLRSQIGGFGQLYILSLPFLFLGIIRLLRGKNFSSFFLLFLIFISPIPASLTKESPHALRSILFAFVFPLVISLGIFDFGNIIDRFRLMTKNKTSKLSEKQKSVFIYFVSFLYILFFASYFFNFQKNYNNLSFSDWQGEYKDLFILKKDLIDKAEKVVISDIYAQPYIFALFYNKFDPLGFRQTATYNPADKWGFSTVLSFDKFIFKDPTDDDIQKGYLVFSDKNISGYDKYMIDNIVFSGKTYFFIYQK